MQLIPCSTIQYILPKMSHKMSKRQKLAPGEEPVVTVSFKSIRDPAFHVTLPSQPVSTSIVDLKHALAQKQNLPEEKLRLLYKKKPCPDTKMVKDLIQNGKREVELGVMVMGGATTAGSAPAASSAQGAKEGGGQPAAEEQTTNGVLQSDDFWKDINEFLKGRLKDESEAEKVSAVFRRAWMEQNTKS